MTTILQLGLAVGILAAAPPAERLTYDAYSLDGANGRQLLLHGVRTYSPACDIEVRALLTNAWDKSLVLEGGFAIAANVYREPKLTGFGITIDKPGRPGFSWEWFDIEEGNVFRKLQGPGRVAVEIATGPGYEELRSIEFLDDIALRYRDDELSRSAGTHTHEVVVRKGSVLRVASAADAAPASPCPPFAPRNDARVAQTPARASELSPAAVNVDRWLTYYYRDPHPEIALSSLDVMESELQKTGRSLATEATRGGLRSFYARVFERDERLVAEVAAKLPSLPAGHQAVLREALRRCGSSACRKAAGMNPPTPDRQPDPSALDDAWASFFATGEAKYVREIIAVLPWVEVRGDVNRLVTGGAARWSLASNAYQHARVLAICEESLRTAPEPTARMLREIVEGAKAERSKNPPAEPIQSPGRARHNY